MDGKLLGNTLDRALLVTVLGKFLDQAAALAESFTALKPGGMLSVTEVNFDPVLLRALNSPGNKDAAKTLR